jgi:hypothetical protein
MSALLDVTLVKPLPDHWLALSFENGEQRLFDVKPLLHKKLLQRLSKPMFLRKHMCLQAR